MAGPAGRRRAKTIRPKFNIFSILDHMTGRYVRGKDDAWYLNGGFSHLMGFAGRGNTFKSAFSGSCIATASLRYSAEYTEFYDTEISLEVGRIQDFINCVAKNNHWDDVPDLEDLYNSETTPWNHNASDEQPGDEWWRTNIRDELKGRRGLKDRQLRSTPFREITGEYTRIPSPWFFNIDSMSEFHVSAVENMFHKAEVGASEMNTESLKDAGSKAQMMKQMPVAAAQGGMYFGMIAHADDEMKLDQYAPSQKKLDGLKGNLKLKGVPGRAFSFLTNNCLLAVAIGNGLGPDKLPMYPHRNQENARPGDSCDIRIVQFAQLRGKSGPTGATIDLVFSQKEGLLVGLTEFHYLKEVCKCFGMEVKGNNQGFRLDLYPDVFFTRKSVRTLLEDDPKFARAMAITAAIAYMRYNWYDMDRTLVEKPVSEIYEEIKNQGYDWEEILTDTVEYWYFEDQKDELNKPTLTAMTILQMAARNYTAKFLRTHPKENVENVKEIVFTKPRAVLEKEAA